MYDSYQRNGGGSGSPTSAGEGDCGRADGADRRSHDFRHQFSVIGQVEDRYDSVEVPRWIACDRRRRLFGGTLGVLLLVAAITYNGDLAETMAKVLSYVALSFLNVV